MTLSAGSTQGGATLTTVPPDRNTLRAVDFCWMTAIVVVLFGLLFREQLGALWDRWTGSADESHGFLIPAFSLYFIYQDRQRWRDLTLRPSIWGAVLILLSVFASISFFFIGMAYPQQIMMLGVMLGIVLLLGGWRALWLAILPICFLVFAIPLPSRLYYNISMPLRELASTVAAMIINVLPNIEWAQSSGVLIHGTHAGSGGSEMFSLNVAEACSGMRLLQAFLALGVAMAYLEKRPLIHRLVLMCSTIPIAVFCNMLRVLLTGLIHIYIGAEYATGTLHTLLGMAMLVVAFGLYGLLAWIMNHLFVEEKTPTGQVLVVGGADKEKN